MLINKGFLQFLVLFMASFLSNMTIVSRETHKRCFTWNKIDNETNTRLENFWIYGKA